MIIKTLDGKLVNFNRIDYIYVEFNKVNAFIVAQMQDSRRVILATYASETVAKMFLDRLYRAVDECKATYTFPNIHKDNDHE